MKSIEVLGKSVDQAIEIGLFKLNAKKEDVKITVIEEGSLFNKARIKLTLEADNEAEKAIQKKVKEFLDFVKLDVNCSVEETEDGFNIDIYGKDAGVIIGRHGDCLDAINVLISQIINKDSDKKFIIRVDSEGYRTKREETLRMLAARMANKAIKDKKPVKLEPMNSYERRIIHTRLQDNDEVVTQSQGVEPHRFLVIYPKCCAPKSLKNVEEDED